MAHAKHDARHAAESRAWRLALLLTGDEDLAADVAIQVRRAQPRLEALDAGRLDRLVVMRSREAVQMAQARRRAARKAGASQTALEADPEINADARAILGALAAMEEQPREAWIFARLDARGEVEVARSMDCSKTATARFLAEADAAMGGALSEPERQIAAVREWLASLSPHRSIEARRAIYRRRRRIWIGVWLLVAAAVITAVLLIIAAL